MVFVSYVIWRHCIAYSGMVDGLLYIGYIIACLVEAVVLDITMTVNGVLASVVFLVLVGFLCFAHMSGVVFLSYIAQIQKFTCQRFTLGRASPA